MLILVVDVKFNCILENSIQILLLSICLSRVNSFRVSCELTKHTHTSTPHHIHSHSPSFLSLSHIHSLGQFHHHFMSALAPIFLRQTKFKPKMYLQKSLAQNKKAARKMLVKLAPCLSPYLSLSFPLFFLFFLSLFRFLSIFLSLLLSLSYFKHFYVSLQL
jgi:hypothetical protein